MSREHQNPPSLISELRHLMPGASQKFTRRRLGHLVLIAGAAMVAACSPERSSGSVATSKTTLRTQTDSLSNDDVEADQVNEKRSKAQGPLSQSEVVYRVGHFANLNYETVASSTPGLSQIKDAEDLMSIVNPDLINKLSEEGRRIPFLQSLFHGSSGKSGETWTSIRSHSGAEIIKAGTVSSDASRIAAFGLAYLDGELDQAMLELKNNPGSEIMEQSQLPTYVQNLLNLPSGSSALSFDPIRFQFGPESTDFVAGIKATGNIPGWGELQAYAEDGGITKIFLLGRQ